MSDQRKYVVGDRVVAAHGARVGKVVSVRQDPLPYRVYFGGGQALWWSGIDLEPAPDPWAEVAIAAALATAQPCARGCGATVPAEREFWATPEYFACLPGPAPLPIRCVSPMVCTCERHAHDRAVAEATLSELARAWAEERARPAAPKVPSKPVDLFGPGWRERDPMRKAGP